MSKSEEDQNKALQDKSHGHEAEVDGYKEQIRQHSVTICAMEERLNKVRQVPPSRGRGRRLQGANTTTLCHDLCHGGKA